MLVVDFNWSGAKFISHSEAMSNKHTAAPPARPYAVVWWPSMRVVRGRLMTEHFDQRAIRRAAFIPRIADHYSRDELSAALAAARRAILNSLAEAGGDVDAGQALAEALDVAIAISRNRASSPN